jgi:hypothetical protein
MLALAVRAVLWLLVLHCGFVLDDLLVRAGDVICLLAGLSGVACAAISTFYRQRSAMTALAWLACIAALVLDEGEFVIFG